jgi:hypothetical protein
MAAMSTNLLTINEPSNIDINKDITITGTWKAEVATPKMEYKLDNGTANVFPSGSTVPSAPTTQAAQSYSVTIPGGFAVAGNHMIEILDNEGGFISVGIVITQPATVPLIKVVDLGSATTLTLANTDVLALNATDGSITQNGTTIPNSYGSAAMGANAVSDNVVWGQDATSGQWFTTDTSLGGAWTLASPQPTTEAAGSGSGSVFSSTSGGIFQKNGSAAKLPGIAVLDAEMGSTPCASILAGFPNNKVIMLAVGASGNGYQTAQPDSAIFAYVDDCVSKGQIVVLSDYVPGQPVARTGSDLTNCCAWYGRMAAHYASEPHVMFTTSNEVLDDGSGSLAASHTAIYNAIRGASAGQGNNQVGFIWMESHAGNPQTTFGLSNATYSAMHKVGWNVHIYPWEFTNLNPSQGQSAYNSQLEGYVNAFQTFASSADGTMPVLFGECGNSTGGNNAQADDPGGMVTAAWLACAIAGGSTGASGKACGSIAWLHDWFNQGVGDSDTLVNPDGTLTAYGQQVSAGQ